MLSPSELEAFSAWELRTRGYQAWAQQVELEPAYYPYLDHVASRGNVDDGRRPGIFASIFRTKEQTKGAPQKWSAPAADPALPTPELVELQLVLPEGFVVRGSFAADLLGSLHNLESPLSFELIGLPEGIVIQLCCFGADQKPVTENLRAYFPEVSVRQQPRFLESEWTCQARYGTIVDFGLHDEFFRQLRVGPHLDTDPLIAVVGALDSLEPSELGLVQVLFRPAVAPWGGDLWDFATRTASKEFRATVAAKLADPLYAAVIRVAALAGSGPGSFERARMLGNAILSATTSVENCLFPLSNDTYPHEQHASDVLERKTRRTGVILGRSELLSLTHLPTASVRAERLRRLSSRTRQAPLGSAVGSTYLGDNEHDGVVSPVYLKVDERLRHTYVIGASGTGKSTLLLSMIEQDIDRGSGVCLLDPHGDLVEDVLARIPLSANMSETPRSLEFSVGG